MRFLPSEMRIHGLLKVSSTLLFSKNRRDTQSSSGEVLPAPPWLQPWRQLPVCKSSSGVVLHLCVDSRYSYSINEISC